MGTFISGWGHCLPEKVLTNQDFESMLDTSDQWITERTGIKERHVGGTTFELATAAASMALKNANLENDVVNGVILATSTPDKMVPATSPNVLNSLGINQGFAFDLNAACAGFVYGLVVGDSLLRNANYQNIILIGADTLSRITDYSDRTTAVLFGDGAGALVLTKSKDSNDFLLGYDLAADGSLENLLYCNHGGFLKMEGKEVFRKAVRASCDSALRVLEKTNVDPSQIYYIPHQANIRIMQAVGERLKIKPENTISVIDKIGNTSSSSIPIALSIMAEKNFFKDGDLLLLSGFGAGMTFATALIRWGR
jgi:3-oxoacyl-[acyl-carrier-protein] synthase-3